MKKHFTFKKISLFLLFVFILIQFIRIDKTNAAINSQDDFLTISSANSEVSKVIKSSCYDCHSNESTYPWYTNIAPVSWWVKNHINEGRGELNFSIWASYSEKRKNHKLEECIEMIEEGEMPMSSYTIMHGEAKLTDAQKLELVDFFKAIKQSNS